MRRDADTGGHGNEQGQEEGADVLSQMIRTLLADADTPPKEVEGVSEEFCDSMPPPFSLLPAPGSARLYSW